MSVEPVVFVFVMATILCQSSAKEGASIAEVNALKKTLKTDYNKHTTPAPFPEYVTVNISVAMFSIGDLDERQEKLTTILLIESYWVDQSMLWDMNETGISSLTMDRSEVWVPDIVIYNQHYDTSFTVEDTIFHTSVKYSNAGWAYYGKKIKAQTSCDLDMSTFPFDSHDCMISLVTDKAFGEIYQSITMNHDVKHIFQPDGAWDVKDMHMDTLDLHVILVRKPMFILVNLILPITLLAFLSPMVFLLPNNSGERVGFSITVLLAISVFMTMVADAVPQKSQPLPRLLVLLLITYSLTVLVAVIVVINARIYRLPNKSRVPRVLVCLHTVMRCCCYCFRRRHTPGNEEVDDGNNENASLTEKVPTQRTATVTWKDVSWTIDMCAMILIYLMKVVFVMVFYVGNTNSLIAEE